MMQNILSLIDAYSNNGDSGGAPIIGMTASSAQTTVAFVGNISTLGTLLVVFSKDRPYQLDQFLCSVRANVRPYPRKVVVLYKDTGAWTDEYSRVAQSHPAASFIVERDFAADLVEIVASSAQSCEVCILCVDDLVFTGPLDVRQCGAALLQHAGGGQAFAYHTKLHPGIVYSHAASRPCPPPPLTFCVAPHAQAGIVPWLSFELAQGTVDWRYPFDLCGSVYRTADVAALLNLAISPTGGERISNPNLLETAGNKLFWGAAQFSRRYMRCLCSPRQCVAVITVNRVQTEYAVPIYASGVSIAELNTETRPVDFGHFLLDPGCSMSVHVGEMFFCEAKDPVKAGPALPSPPAPLTPDCSILLPVYNAERYLGDCLASLVRSILSDQPDLAVEIIVAIDGSTDRSCEIASAFALPEVLQGRVIYRVKQFAHQGLTATLDAGLQLCSAEFVARMDADDVCEPGRLARQVAFLRANPGIHVVGGQAALLEGGKAEGMVASGVPCHPVLVHWTMFFRCCLLHPTAMLRKSVALQCGGYGGLGLGLDGGYGGPVESEACRARDTTAAAAAAAGPVDDLGVIEDYSLWMRILERHPQGVASLPDVMLQLRRRCDSKSAIEATHVRETSQRLRLRCLGALLGCSAEELGEIEGPYQVLVRPDLLAEEGQVVRCLALLQRMLARFCAVHALHPDAESSDRGDMLVSLLRTSCARLERNIYRSAARKNIAVPAQEGAASVDIEVEALKVMLSASFLQ